MRRVVMNFSEDDDFGIPEAINKRKGITDRRGGGDQ
jgi:hypothetical protein